MPAVGTPITVTDLTTTSGGYIQIDWDDTTIEPTPAAWRVFVRRTGTTDWHLAFETTDFTVTTWSYNMYNFPTDPAGVEITVGQVSIEGGELILGALDVTQAVTPTFDHHYWLIDPYNESNNLRLEHTRSDTFSEDHELEVYHLIGRGRVLDQGDRLGFSGSLSGHFWDFSSNPLDAYDQALQFYQHRATKGNTYLRTPFVDVFPIAIVGFQADRVPGMGTDYAFLDYSLDYVELEGNNPEYNAAAAGALSRLLGATVTTIVNGYQLSWSIPIFSLTNLEVPPEVVLKDGNIADIAIGADSAPLGGSHIFGVAVNGTEVATIELAANATVSSVTPLAIGVTQGQLITAYPKSTTATTEATGITVSIRLEDA